MATAKKTSAKRRRVSAAKVRGKKVGGLGKAAAARLPRARIGRSRLLDHPAAAQASFRDPRLDHAHEWNWKDGRWYVDRGLPSPFVSTNNAGEDVTGTTSCLPRDGWELFSRRILNLDGFVKKEGDVPVVMDGQLWFALYNVRSGVMRVFIFFEAGDYWGSDHLVARACCSIGDESNEHHAHGLFNNIGAVSRTLEEARASMKDNFLMTRVSQVTNGWLVLDYPLAYDQLRTYTSSPYYLSISVKSVTNTELSLSGHFEGASRIDSSITPGLARLTSAVGKFAGDVTASNKDIAGAANSMRNLGIEASSRGGDGTPLVALAGILGSLSPALGAVVSGSRLISNLMQFGGSGGVKYSMFEGMLNLSGDAVTPGFRRLAAISILDSDEAIPEEIPYFFKVHPGVDLGVVNMIKLPAVHRYRAHGTQFMASGGYEYFEVISGVPADSAAQLLVNPAAPFVPRNIRTQLVLIQERELPRGMDDQGTVLACNGFEVSRDVVTGKTLSVFPREFESPVASCARRFVVRAKHWRYDLPRPEVMIRVAFDLVDRQGRLPNPRHPLPIPRLGESITVMMTYGPLVSSVSTYINNSLDGSWPDYGKAIARYRVGFRTSLAKKAGTDSRVYVTLFGSLGVSQEFRVDQPGVNNFERGREEYFDIDCQDLGDVWKVVVRHDNTKDSPAWLLEEVRVTHGYSGREWRFACNLWIGGKGSLSRELSVIS